MFSLWSICMSLRLNASLCFPQGILKSTTGVCWLVFLPSIQTSDQGTELTVMVQSPPLSPPRSAEAFGPLSSSALALGSSPAAATTSCAFLRRGPWAAGGGGGAASAWCVSAGGLGGAACGAGGTGGVAGGATATSGCDVALPDPVVVDPGAGINMAWTFWMAPGSTSTSCRQGLNRFSPLISRR